MFHLAAKRPGRELTSRGPYVRFVEIAVSPACSAWWRYQPPIGRRWSGCLGERL